MGTDALHAASKFASDRTGPQLEPCLTPEGLGRRGQALDAASPSGLPLGTEPWLPDRWC